MQCLLYDVFEETDRILNQLIQYEITKEQVSDFVLKYVFKEYLEDYEKEQQNMCVSMICLEFEHRKNSFL